MKIFYHLFHFLCCATLILPATCSFVDPDRCLKYNGHCKRSCATDEKQVDICFSPSKICCAERLYEEDNLF
ncbi:beta-defensin 114 [Trichechus manatus latirostris]|uniref:Beta-defensin n=1 Tax=Trichechus manatus latirostris TaxID=127582 RepID=A0A2Y9S227_TRIMA|nr:beta-defensin 114 [Trichechus manatus latirostris]